MTAEKLVIFVFFYSIFYSLVFMLTANTVTRLNCLFLVVNLAAVEPIMTV